MIPITSGASHVVGKPGQSGSGLAVAGILAVLAWAAPMLPAADSAEPMAVGGAEEGVTPDYPIRLNGFGGRRAESEGVTEKIWAKALAFGDAQLGPAVIITTDNLGVPAEMTLEVAKRLGAKTGLRPERLSIT